MLQPRADMISDGPGEDAHYNLVVNCRVDGRLTASPTPNFRGLSLVVRTARYDTVFGSLMLFDGRPFAADRGQRAALAIWCTARASP